MLWLKSCHSQLPSAYNADTCDEMLGASMDVACGAPMGSAARASIAAHRAQAIGRCARRARQPGTKVMADAVSAMVTVGCMRAAYKPGVWRWMQSRANPSPRLIPSNREINREFGLL